MTPNRIAVNEATGDLYVIDEAHNLVNRFNSAGVYQSQLKVPAEAGGSFEFNEGEDDIAVDNSGGANAGSVYVIGEGGGKISAFASNGTFKWQVTSSYEGNNATCGVAVDASGNLWTADYFHGIQKRSVADGSTIGTPVLGAPENACHFDLDSAGDIYLNHWNQRVQKYDQSGTLLGTIEQLGGTDVTVDRTNGVVYTALKGANHYVTIRTETPSPSEEGEMAPLLGKFGQGTFSNLVGVAVNPANHKIYASDPGTGKIYIYDAPPTLTVDKTGSGAGTVTSDIGGINCGATCSATYEKGEEATLTAAAETGSKFTGWSGCSSEEAGKCKVTLNADTTVSANFEPKPNYALTVSKAGTGSGTVTGNPAGINCGGTCSAEYEEGKLVTLTAAAATHSHFTGWSGCTPLEADPKKCKVTVDAAKAVTATFDLDTSTLTVNKAGTGTGSVTCDGGACASSYPYGTKVVLAATADSGSGFSGFSGGGCSASPCTVTIEADTTVTATFSVNPPSGGGGGGGGEEENPNAYGQCVAKATKAYNKAKKAAAKKHGKARATAIKAAKKRKSKAVARCRAEFK